MKRFEPMINLVKIRKAVANYMRSEGCSCYQGADNRRKHVSHLVNLARLLKVPKYKDGSGYNFRRYEATK